MANVSKMSAANAPEAAPGHAASPFFNVLPPEIRLNIYKKAFQGASVHATLTIEDDHSSGGGKQHLVRFRHCSHFDLLLRCRKIYDEALPTYWSEASLHIVPLRTIETSLAPSDHWLRDAKYTADDYTYHLCNSLPEIVKANIKHVRGMILPPLHGRFVKKYPKLTATAMLSGFKSLVTCEISPTILDNPEVEPFGTNISIKSYIHLDTDSNNENDTDGTTNGNNESIAENDPTDPLTLNRGRFKTSWEQVCYEPKDLLHKICGIDATAKVMFLVKGELHLAVYKSSLGTVTAFKLGLSACMPDIQSWTPRSTRTVYQFWNLSTGIFCEVDPKKVTEEEGFDMVVRGGPEFEVAGGQTG